LAQGYCHKPNTPLTSPHPRNRAAMSEKTVGDEWRATFDFMDKDRSGTIGVDEAQECFKAFGQSLSKEDVEKHFQSIDTNNDGCLDYTEFVQLMSSTQATQISRKVLQKYFNMLDKDGSGYITTAELRHCFTSFGHGFSDEMMNTFVDSYDLDGNGQLLIDEFEVMVKDMGLEVVEDDEGPDVEEAPIIVVPQPAGVPELVDDLVAVKDPVLAKVLKPLENAEGKVSMSHVQQAVDLWQKLHSVNSHDPESDPALHWEKDRVKRGLGGLIYKANHIALIVSDVGKSAHFYSDVLGFQQIRRPDFDRHGAWFTMGNLELHLIKGVPIVHSGKDLIVGHISIETYEIDRVPEILEKMGVPFRQNVSVPKGKMAQGSGTNASNNSSSIVKQYFLRDPDGYYLEICNCDILTKYCLGDKKDLAGYDEGVGLGVQNMMVLVNLGHVIANKVRQRQDELVKLSAELKGCKAKVIAERLGLEPATKVDEEKLKKLLVRRTVYGDVVQNESEDDIKDILALAGNSVPLAVKIMRIKAHEGSVFHPPAFFDGGKTKIVPESVYVAKRQRTE